MRDKIRLNSTGKTKAGKNTGYFRTTTKNKKLGGPKMEVNCFDPRAYNEKTGKCGMHVKFVEGKI